MNVLLRWYHTIRPLKPVQLWHLIVRPARLRFSNPYKPTPEDIEAALSHASIPMVPLQVEQRYWPDRKEFSFLNRTVTFPNGIEWDYKEEGLLWAYNLNYFEWLYDDSISTQDRLSTILDFVACDESQKVAAHAYPASLRIVAWIRFLLRFGIKDETILKRLFSDAGWLSRYPEYHLQGNHLWENAVALLSAGLYFRNKRFYNQGRHLLKACMSEQVLADGGHIEGSPMYHSLLLWRLMQCHELLQAIPLERDEMDTLVAAPISLMLGWVRVMTFSDGEWPMFNDCCIGIAPPSGELIRYGSALKIYPAKITLKESGYRMISAGDFELAIDVSGVQPSYQPGHTHADTGTFCLYYKGRPVIVDTGTSTYEVSERRSAERGTEAHNTVTIGGRDSSEVWKSFRVGRRGKVLSVEETRNAITIIYKPYASPAIAHRRAFSWNDNCIVVADALEGVEAKNAAAFLHFHPEIKIQPMDQFTFQAGTLTVSIEGAEAVCLNTYAFAGGINQLFSAECLRIGMSQRLITEFSTKII